ncbi:MAG: DUF58 domain-containing protein [Candidatus Gracilibacteria bacterium]|nr:DUF58 domain-containing protein [Candidatus Gracilibacteria bacterium]MDQ7022060.1 DUF58 domain-containing protein [Candidatus Gracilibacteria bacterium]
MKIQNKIKSLEIKISKLLNGGLFGNYKSKLHGNGMEFAEHREYNFGDPVKNIDWKASFKGNSMQIKNYEEEKDLNILFVLDNSSSMDLGSSIKTKKENLEELFYSLAISAYNNNDNIGTIIFDEKNINFTEHKKSKNNIFKILEKCNKKNILTTEGFSPLKDNFLQEIIKRKIKNNLIIILTDKTKFEEKLLKIINSQNEIILINIFDEIENELITTPSPSLKRWGILNTFSLNLGTDFINISSNSDKISEYKKSRKQKLEKLKFNLEKQNIGYIKIDNKMDSFKELLKFFNKK